MRILTVKIAKGEKSMKLYRTPEIEVIRFKDEDVITGSAIYFPPIGPTDEPLSIK